MGRIKPAALLRQSKKQKGPSARPSVTAVAASLVFLVVVLLSIAFVSRGGGGRGAHGGLERASQYVVFNTTRGLLTLQLSGRRELGAVESFVARSQHGDYEGWRFEKVMDFFVMQGGEQGSDGTDGDSLSDVKVGDVAGAGRKFDPFTLTSENLGPDTNSSRFFITTTDTYLNRDKYLAIGRFVGDISVLQGMEDSLLDKSRQPVDHVVIHNILSL